MKNNYREFLLKTAIVAVALLLVFNFSATTGCLAKIATVLKPVFVGILVASVLAVPLDFFDKKVFRKVKNKKAKRFLALFCTFSLFAGALLLLGFLVIPQSCESVREIMSLMSDENAWNGKEGGEVFLFLTEKGKLLYERFRRNLGTYFPEILSACKVFLNGVYNVLFGTFIAVLLLVGKDSIKRQFKNTLALILPEDKTKKVYVFLRLIFAKFSKYLGGQVTEAFILGIVTYAVMFLLQIPYPALVGLIVGFVNLIPVVGAYVGGGVCALLIFAVNPIKALVFIIADFVLQQVESFTTYPMIVGKYVGLSGFWITVSVLVWGGLFGFWGLVLGVPFTAVLQDLLRVKSQNKKNPPQKIHGG